jgi:ABC-type glycerol-3-phosphate transport system substrate-binding protein
VTTSPATTSGAASAGTLARRAFLGSLAAGAAAFAVFGPRGVGEKTTGRIVLDYWEKWAGHEGKTMQTIVDRFNESQSRIFVRYLVTAGVDEKGMVAIAGGSPPDLLGLYAYNIPLFAERGAILPLEEYGESLSASRYAAGLRTFVKHPGKDGSPKTWGVISAAGTLAMYYNKRRLAEAGLSGPPMVMEEFDDCNRKLTEFDGSGDVVRGGFIHSEPGWWSWIWSQPFGGRLWDPSTGKSSLTEDATVRGYDWVRSTAAMYDPAKNGAFSRFRARFGNYDAPTNAFLTGQLAMIVQGPWLANVIEAHHDRAARAAGKPELDYGVVPVPAIAGLRDDANPIGAAEADVVVIPRGVKHPDACVEFLRFCQKQENLEELARQHFKGSPLATSSESFLATHPNKGIATFDTIAKSPRAFVTPRTRVWPEIKREMDAAMDDLYRGEKTAAVLGKVDARVQGILDRHKAQRARRGIAAGAHTPHTLPTVWRTGGRHA